MTIKLLHACGDDPEGAVIDVNDSRARNLIIKGYAVEVKPKAKKVKE